MYKSLNKLISYCFCTYFWSSITFFRLYRCVGWQLCWRLWSWNGLSINTYTSMYARTNRCYNERGSRTNYVRSSIPHCTLLREWRFGGPHNTCCGPIIFRHISAPLGGGGTYITHSQNHSPRRNTLENCGNTLFGNVAFYVRPHKLTATQYHHISQNQISHI